MRGLWVLLMIAGVIGFTGLAIVMFFGIPIGPDVAIRSRGLWPILSLFAAGACGAGIFMSPREFKQTMTPPPPPPRPAWMDDLAKPAAPPTDSTRE